MVHIRKFLPKEGQTETCRSFVRRCWKWLWNLAIDVDVVDEVTTAIMETRLHLGPKIFQMKIQETQSAEYDIYKPI